MTTLLLATLTLTAAGTDPNPLAPEPAAAAVRANPLGGPPAAAASPARMPDTYGSVRDRVAAGETVLVAVGVSAPVGYTAVTDAPAGVRPGLYRCTPAASGPVMALQSSFFPAVCGPNGCPTPLQFPPSPR